MLRAARAGDEAAIEAFLAGHAETSMFLRGNLVNLGMFDRETPHATEYFIAEGPEGITAVFGFSNAGFAMSQAPDGSEALWADFAARLVGRKLVGITGEGAQVVRAKAALGVEAVPYALDDPEPLYRLELAELVVPDGPGQLRAPTEADRDLLFTLTRAYSAELHMSSPDRLDEEARGRADRALTTGDVQLLEVDGKTVAMTALNTRLPDMVQIGGVYTPPELRARGHARRAVALHLEEVRGEGVAVAILFASGEPACRAYEAIGFQRIGTYALAILKDPVMIGGTP